MSWTSFGERTEGIPYLTLDERAVRGSAGILMALGLFAAVNAFVLRRFEVLPYVSGFLVLNFLVGLFIHPTYAPTMLLSKLLVRKQTAIPIGAVQKRFAWSLGLILSVFIFSLSLPLQRDATYFEPVCLACIVCLGLLFLESVFAICVGCSIYRLGVRIGWLAKPEVAPNCMGDACRVEADP